MSNIAIITQTDSETDLNLAQHWATRLNIPLLSLSDDLSTVDFILQIENQRLALSTAQQLNTRVYSEFINENMGYRLKNGGGRKQPLARACGLKPNDNPTILDLSAGLGKDGFILASLGCEVTLIERHPIVAALLENGLFRAAQQPQTQAICQRLQLQHANSFDYLETANPVDMIYFDPMYPKRHKKALVKKSMQLLQALVGADSDAHQLLPLALTKANKRVVVKRPKNAASLGEIKPSMCVSSKNTRYDVYLTSNYTTKI